MSEVSAHTTHPSMPSPTPPASPALPLETRLAYSGSAFAENLAYNSIVQLANPIFNLVLGVSPVLIGLALALPRLWDAFVDPWVGAKSDALRSRWGRRRPFIAVGAVITGLVAAGIWFFPTGQTPLFYFGWLLGGSLLMATAYSIFVVPYGALGLELAPGYHERTRLMAIKSAFHKSSGVVNQWLVKLVQLAAFGGILAGTRFCGVVIGCVVIALGLWTALRVPERHAFTAAPPARRLSWSQSWKQTLSQRDFARLVFAQVCIYASVLIVDNVGFYLNVFYVNDGNLQYGALIKGAAGTAFQVGGLASIPLIAWLARRIGKKQAFLWCTLSIALGGVAKWFCYVPGAGWWLVLPSLLLAPGLVAVMVLVPSMTADVCDVDEVTSGARREGIFNAVAGWLLKLSMSGAFFVAGVLLSASGWETSRAAAQTPETFMAMRVMFSVGTVALALAAAYLIRGYGITEATVADARAKVARVKERTSGV